MCSSATIASNFVIGSGSGTTLCYVGSCGSFLSISTDTRCTDFSAVLDFSSGERYDVRTVNISQSYTFGFWGTALFALAIGGNADWQVTAKANLVIRPDGVINSSPMTSFLPILYATVNTLQVLKIPMFDVDATDTLKCRWSTNPSSITGYDECGSICAPSLPTGYALYLNNCTLVFTLTVTNYYAIALQIEDFYTSSSTTPMSSIPVQLMMYGRPSLNSSCTLAPAIIGARPNSGIE